MIWILTKISILIVLSFLASSCAVSQPKYAATRLGLNSAILEGKLKEALTDDEAQAREAEKNAMGSLFPQQYWSTAVRVYNWAAS